MAEAFTFGGTMAGASAGSAFGPAGTAIGAAGGFLLDLAKYVTNKKDRDALEGLADQEYNNAIASYNLQLRQDKLELTGKRIDVQGALDNARLSQEQIAYEKGNYEAFLDWFGSTDKADELGVSNSGDSTDLEKAATRAAFEEVWNNFAMNDVSAGYTGRLGGAETSMGQTALAALDVMKGTVGTAQQQVDIYARSLESLGTAVTSLESTLQQIDDILAETENTARDIAPAPDPATAAPAPTVDELLTDIADTTPSEQPIDLVALSDAYSNVDTVTGEEILTLEESLSNAYADVDMLTGAMPPTEDTTTDFSGFTDEDWRDYYGL